MESIRRNFFNGIRDGEKKIAWVSWSKVLASKSNGGCFRVKDVRRLLDRYALLTPKSDVPQIGQADPHQVNGFGVNISMDSSYSG
ncbi:hypothetical protein Tco_0645426 [Tanacetum coccineum]